MARDRKNCQDEYNAPFAARLRVLLEESGCTQVVLATYIGVTRQAVSSYALGTSAPDIYKLEAIADYFGVSTEYLLGRTEIKKADASKQAAANYLGLSEEAIDAICGLQGIHFEQTIEKGYKVAVKESEPLPELFSKWLVKVDLPALMSNVWKTLCSTVDAQDSAWSSNRYVLTQEQKNAVQDLKQHGYLTLSQTEQVSFFSQSATEEFNRSVDRMISETIQMINEENEAESQQ